MGGPAVPQLGFSGDPERLLGRIYGSVGTVIALMFNVLWGYAYRRGLIAGTAGGGGLRASLGFLTGPMAYLAGTLIALVNPFISMAIWHEPRAAC